MPITKKSKKPLIILLAILGTAVIIAALFGIYYTRADTLVYHYIDVPNAFMNGTDYPIIEEKEDYPRRFPFFGNPLTISEDQGATVSYPMHAGERYSYVYLAINDPIQTWILYLEMRYKNDARADYTVEKDNEYIRVHFTGTLTENGEVTPIEQKFVFDIRNVGIDSPPKWVNSDEISDGYREFLNYCNNKDNVEAPDWLTAQAGN